MAKWQVTGDYFEACNCDFLCQCVITGMQAKPTHGHCDVGLVFHVERGSFDETKLDGLNFAIVAHSPGVMGHGNWTVGLLIDERGDAKQREALTTIASGQ